MGAGMPTGVEPKRETRGPTALSCFTSQRTQERAMAIHNTDHIFPSRQLTNEGK